MNYRDVIFGEFSSFKYGKMPNKKMIKENGRYPIYSGYRYVGYCDEYNTEANQLIVVARGVGGTGDVKLTTEKSYLTNLSISANVDADVAMPEYLYYYFRINNLRYLDSGSAQSQITIADLQRVIIPLPDLETQKKVTAILCVLDKKINRNNAINHNLQHQAQAIYNQMFIYDTENMMKQGTLNDIAIITMGQSPNGNTYNEDANGTVFYQGRAEFGFRFPKRRLYTTEPKRIAEFNDVLISVRAPVGDINVAYEKCCIGRGLGAIHSKNENSSFVLYTMFALKPQLDVYNGEGTVFGSINRNALSSMPINIPSAEKIAQFESIVHPMDNIIRINYEETCRLEILRDSLLPKLMSGEIDVSGIDI